jgi:hypothetical protein
VNSRNIGLANIVFPTAQYKGIVLQWWLSSGLSQGHRDFNFGEQALLKVRGHMIIITCATPISSNVDFGEIYRYLLAA